jgi:hypothetical protein
MESVSNVCWLLEAVMCTINGNSRRCIHDVHAPLRYRYFLGDMGEEVDAFAEDFRLLASVKRRSKTAPRCCFDLDSNDTVI